LLYYAELPTPKNIEISNITQSSVFTKWRRVAGSTGYRVILRNYPQFEIVKVSLQVCVALHTSAMLITSIVSSKLLWNRVMSGSLKLDRYLTKQVLALSQFADLILVASMVNQKITACVMQSHLW